MMRLSRHAQAALAIAVLVGAPAAASAADPLKVGIVLSLTGPAAPFGIPERDAVEVIVKKINSAGGVGGRQIELAICDDGTNPTEAPRCVTQLVQRDKVQAIIGATIGSATLAMAPVAMRSQVPIVAPNATMSVTSRANSFYPWVFRAATSDLTTTKAVFDKTLAAGAKRIAIFYQEDAYGKDTADYLQELAKKAGITVVDTASAPLSAMNVTVHATKLRNAEPDAVIVQVSQPALAAAFVTASRQVGLKAQFWGGPGFGQAAFIKAAGAAAEGARVVIMANWDDPSPREKEFMQLLATAGKTPQGFGDVAGANAIITLVEAVKSVTGEVTGEKLRAALEKLCGVKTYAEGSACYGPDNHDGWTEEMLSSATIKDGKFKRE
jgi:branched-chain amino acid transport system substrate-binding protein